MLEKEKCELFEIFEWPQVLQLEGKEIERRILYLRDKDLPVSVGHLRCVDRHEKYFRANLKKYHRTTQGTQKFHWDSD